MLGNNRPDEIASGNEFALGFPVLLILRIPVRNPGRVPLAHERLSFLERCPLVACRRRPKERPPPKALESVVQGGGVACSVDKSDPRAVDGDGPQLQCTSSFVPTPASR